MGKEGVSIILCCFNSEERIAETLSYIQKTEATIPWEVILVNNASTDQTSRVALKQWGLDPVVCLDIVNENTPGLSHARLAGVKKAQFKVLAFVDDDNHIPPSYVQKVHEKFGRVDIGVLGVCARPIFEKEPPTWFQKHQHAYATGELYEQEGNVSEIGNVYGAGMCIRKKVFEDLEALNWKPRLTGRIGAVQMGGEDSELCFAAKLLGYKIWYDPKILIGHLMPASRLSEEKLLSMTAGFGYADVFLLPYEVAWRERINASLPGDSSRESVFSNYMGKKWRLLKLWWNRNSMDPLDYKVQRIRAKAFIEALLGNKVTFLEGFKQVERIF